MLKIRNIVLKYFYFRLFSAAVTTSLSLFGI